jgi:hypothetical protein
VTTDTPTTLPAIVEAKIPISMGERGFELRNLDAAWRFAQGLIQGGMAPKGLNHPGSVVAIIEAGMELGMPPMFALSSLHFINGRIGIGGDGARALIRAKGMLKEGTGIACEMKGEPGTDDYRAEVTSHRCDEAKPVTHSFSVRDAKVALLWGKRTKSNEPTPWVTAPDRMLMYRALGFHVRDQYSDVLMGVGIVEELRDYEPQPGEKLIHPERQTPTEPDPLLSRTGTAGGEKVVEELILEMSESSTPPVEDCPHAEGYAFKDGSDVKVCIECNKPEPQEEKP